MHEAITTEHYTAISKWIHWIVALIVIPMVFGSFYLDMIPKLYRSGVINLHKSFGLTILCLMLIRVIYIHVVGRPALPDTVVKKEKLLVRLIQYALYLALILMPIFGWVMSTAAGKTPHYFGLFALPFPGITPDKALAQFMFDLHNTTAYVIICLLVLHIAGALKHRLINKDNVLASMLPSCCRK